MMRMDLPRIMAVWLAVLLVVTGSAAAQSADAEAGVSFSEVTAKFVRNMRLLQKMTPDAEIQRQVNILVAKAEDLSRIGNLKNADNRRSEIIRQREKSLNREGISESDRKRLDKLQQELRDLDPDGRFSKARAEMSRAIAEFNNQISTVVPVDPKSRDVLRLLRLHVEYYNRSISKLP